MLELKQLRLFIAVAENGGFSPAAKKLYISHSTLSRGVTGLEKELGVKLIERSNKVEKLTAAGEQLLEEGKALLEAADKLEQRIREI